MTSLLKVIMQVERASCRQYSIILNFSSMVMLQILQLTLK